MDSRFLVRPMREDDLDLIMFIEKASFPTPWARQAFISELTQNDYARYFCLELEGKVIGYMGLWYILEEGHITNIAIHPFYRGQGWGEYLMREVIGRMRDQGMERMTLEVRVSNQPARTLYERMGFSAAGVRKGYYSDNQEDALIMWLEIV